MAFAGGAETGICFGAGGTGFREKAAGMLPDALCLLVEPFCQNTFSPENFKVQNKKTYINIVMDPSWLCQLEDALHSSQPILPQMIIPENDIPKTLHLIPKNNTLGNHNKQMLESKLRFIRPLPLLFRWSICCFGLLRLLRRLSNSLSLLSPFEYICIGYLICWNPINAKRVVREENMLLAKLLAKKTSFDHKKTYWFHIAPVAQLAFLHPYPNI